MRHVHRTIGVGAGGAGGGCGKSVGDLRPGGKAWLCSKCSFPLYGEVLQLTRESLAGFEGLAGLRDASCDLSQLIDEQNSGARRLNLLSCFSHRPLYCPGSKLASDSHVRLYALPSITTMPRVLTSASWGTAVPRHVPFP